MEKIRIEGIKLSEELCQVNLVNHPHPQRALSRVCRLFSENRINMPFLAATCRGRDTQTCCCVSLEDRGRALGLLEAEPDLKPNVGVLPSVGLLSVFPHQSSIQLLGVSLVAFGEAGIPVYGVASSLAPITLVTDYARLDEAVAALEEHMELPPNQRPIRAAVRVVQSSITREEDGGSEP